MNTLRKLILISMGGLFVFISSFAQESVDQLALDFSRTYTGGSARILGLGGVNTSLGGDISSISNNPAGLGFYNRSEVSLTPVINLNSTSTSYLGTDDSRMNTNFSIGNLGVVINNSRSDRIPGPWKGGSFGFSYNRINDFNRKVYYNGTNTDNDYIDYLLNFANSNNVGVGDFYLVDLPFYNYLINDYSVSDAGDTIDNVWDSFVEFPSPQTPVEQSEKIITSGYQNKWDLSYGGNLSDRFYFGLGLGIVSLKYTNEKLYREKRYEGSILDYYTLFERQKLEGVGVQANFGIIVRPVNTITVGLNYTTPAVYSITDNFETSLESVWNPSANDVYGDDNNFTLNPYEETTLEPLTYIINTPQRVAVGASYFFNKNGFVSGDIEWVNYSKAVIRSNDQNFNHENDAISNNYRSAFNYRVGGEYRAGIFRIRGGFNYQTDPLQKRIDVSKSIMSYSGGIGLREKSFYTDATFLYSVSHGNRAPYLIDPSQEIGPTPVADITYQRSSIIVSAGFMF